MPKAFENNDTVCFIGDSITHAATMHSLVYLYYATRFPDRVLRIWNCGRAGGRVSHMLARYGVELPPLKPNRAVVMFGMNDCGRDFYGPGRDTPENIAQRREHDAIYDRDMRALLQRLQADGCGLTLMTPTPYDQTAAGRPDWAPEGRVEPGHEHVNDALGRYADWTREHATEWGADVVDFHRPITDLTLRLQQQDPGFSLTFDRIHPNGCWYLLFAYEFLTQTGMPAEVALAGLDAHSLAVTHAINSTVSNVGRSPHGLGFDWHARSLPCPVDAADRPALAYVPFMEKLNREMLSVTGLPAGEYRLLIDGVEVGRYGGAELATGVNLAANADTPQYRQAVEVMKLNRQRHELNEALQDANMVVSFREPGLTDEQLLGNARKEGARDASGWSGKVNRNYVEYHDRIEASRQTLLALMAEIYRINQPLCHHVELCRM